MNKLSVLAPAKVNLYLNVKNRRPDGYHEIESVMQSITLFDRIEVTKNDSPKGENITILCRNPIIPLNEKNLIHKAALAFFEYTNITEYDIVFTVEKKIPTEAGLGGGSADAAATLIALDRLYGTALPLETLYKIGAKLGADIPFCIKKGTVYTTGIGEIMESAPPMPDCAFVIAKPKGSHISTAEAYRAIDSLPPDPTAVSFDEFKKAVSACDIQAIAARLYNQFELVTPKEAGVVELLATLQKTNPLGARMSGSGSAVFAVYPDVSSARKAKDTLPPSVEAFICTPARRDYPYIEA